MPNPLPSIATAVSTDCHPHTTGACQMLWHLSRADSPTVTAVLTEVDGRFMIDVTYGRVARQSVVFTSSMEAVEWAERRRAQVEAFGYCRTRPKRR